MNIKQCSMSGVWGFKSCRFFTPLPNFNGPPSGLVKDTVLTPSGFTTNQARLMRYHIVYFMSIIIMTSVQTTY